MWLVLILLICLATDLEFSIVFAVTAKELAFGLTLWSFIALVRVLVLT